MKILITGSKGFVGKNLITGLHNKGYNNIFEYDLNKNEIDLENYIKQCDFVFHLAGINRTTQEQEFVDYNYKFTKVLLEKMKKYNNKSPILATSSIQAELDNPYGKSKKAMEDLLFLYSKKNNINVYVYRLTNLFGKWCRPNYNSVIATFCNNIAREIPIEINNKEKKLKLAYIDDVVEEFINAIEGKATMNDRFGIIPISYEVKLGKIVSLIQSFKESRKNLIIPNVNNEFTKKLYSTYLSYLPEEDFAYEPKVNKDERGTFTELLKTKKAGQISLNTLKPGVVKGNHWHNTKNEKFIVISGKGIIRFRKINSNKIIEYFVSSEKLEIVDIPVGYVHNIENLGNTDMIILIWASEMFNLQKTDTYFEKV